MRDASIAMIVVALAACRADLATPVDETSTSTSESTSSSEITALVPTTLVPLDTGSSGDTLVDPSLTPPTTSTTDDPTTETSGSTSNDATSSTSDDTSGSTSESSTGSTTESSTTDPLPPDVPIDPTCDVFAQDCPDGSKCMPWASGGAPFWNDTACFAIDREPDAVGEACTVLDNALSGLDSCELGAICWNVDPFTAMGVCHALCTGNAFNPVCDDPTMGCAVFDPLVLDVCVPACDPLLQDCGQGQTCVPLGDFVCLGDGSGPAGAQGDPCEALNGCDPGLICINGVLVPECETFGCCSAWCDLEDAEANAVCAATAGEGAACLPFFGDDPPQDLENLGVCILE